MTKNDQREPRGRNKEGWQFYSKGKVMDGMVHYLVLKVWFAGLGEEWIVM